MSYNAFTIPLPVNGTQSETTGLTAGSLNADLVPSTAVGNNRSFSLQILGTWVGTLTFQVSDDNLTFTSLSADDPSATGSVTGVSTTTNRIITGDFGGAKYFRVRMTAYTSGTATGLIEFSTDTRSPRQVIASSVQAGTWTVQPGNTANTTPWLVQSSFTPVRIATAATTTVKSGAGILHTISINTLGTVASSITVYDNTTATGTPFAVINALANERFILFDATFTVGLTIVTTGTVAPDITVTYR